MLLTEFFLKRDFTNHNKYDVVILTILLETEKETLTAHVYPSIFLPNNPPKGNNILNIKVRITKDMHIY